MRNSTLELIRCVQDDCGQPLKLGRGSLEEGALICSECEFSYPILSGIPILVPDPDQYILEHVKGISRWVRVEALPQHLKKEFSRIQKEIEAEHIEEDLESDRVNALYFMCHYLDSSEMVVGIEDPVLKELVTTHWDSGPLQRVGKQIHAKTSIQSVVEMGCGVGGLARFLGSGVNHFLGVDSSFASVALARWIWGLSRSEQRTILVPEDLARGPLTRKIDLKRIQEKLPPFTEMEFVVGDLERPPVKNEKFDASIVLNAIDMMHEPEILPEIQKAQVRVGGYVIQSSPYVWHEVVLARLRSLKLKGKDGKKLTFEDSAKLVRHLYEIAGLQVSEEMRHVPWLFFKHQRQLELYSVHVLVTRR